MPAERLSVRKIKEVLPLKFIGDLTGREFVASCGISCRMMGEYIQRHWRVRRRYSAVQKTMGPLNPRGSVLYMLGTPNPGGGGCLSGKEDQLPEP